MGMMAGGASEKNYINLSYNNVLGTLVVNDKKLDGPYSTVIAQVKAEVGDEIWKKGYESNAKARELYAAKIKAHNSMLAPGEEPMMNNIRIVGTLDRVSEKVLKGSENSTQIFEVVLGDGSDAYAISLKTDQAVDLVSRLCSGQLKLGDKVEVSVFSKSDTSDNGQVYTNIYVPIKPVINGKVAEKSVSGVEGFYKAKTEAENAAVRGTPYEKYDPEWSDAKKTTRRNMRVDAAEQFLVAAIRESGMIKSSSDSGSGQSDASSYSEDDAGLSNEGPQNESNDLTQDIPF